nr:unnamed protein product [Digitaria exilis]
MEMAMLTQKELYWHTNGTSLFFSADWSPHAQGSQNRSKPAGSNGNRSNRPGPVAPLPPAGRPTVTRGSTAGAECSRRCRSAIGRCGCGTFGHHASASPATSPSLFPERGEGSRGTYGWIWWKELRSAQLIDGACTRRHVVYWQQDYRQQQPGRCSFPAGGHGPMIAVALCLRDAKLQPPHLHAAKWEERTGQYQPPQQSSFSLPGSQMATGHQLNWPPRDETPSYRDGQPGPRAIHVIRRRTSQTVSERRLQLCIKGRWDQQQGRSSKQVATAVKVMIAKEAIGNPHALASRQPGSN